MGACFGAAAGAGLVYLAFKVMSLEDPEGAWFIYSGIPLGAFLGGLIGAEIGAEHTSERWRTVPLREIRGPQSGMSFSLSISLLF